MKIKESLAIFALCTLALAGCAGRNDRVEVEAGAGAGGLVPFTTPPFVAVSAEGQITTYQVVDGQVEELNPRLAPAGVLATTAMVKAAAKAIAAQTDPPCGQEETIELTVNGQTVTVAVGSNPALSLDGTKLAHLRSAVAPSGECEDTELVVRDLTSSEERSWGTYFPETVNIDGQNTVINGGGIVTTLAWSPAGLLAYGTYDSSLWVLNPATSGGSTIRNATQVRANVGAWQIPSWFGDELVVTAIGEFESPLQVVDVVTGAATETLVADSIRPIEGDVSGDFLLYEGGDVDSPQLVVRSRAGAEVIVSQGSDLLTVLWSR